MEEKSNTSLKCYIHKFRNRLDLSRISQIYQCLRHRLLAIHYEDGNIDFLKIDLKSRSVISSLQGIQRLVCIYYLTQL